MKQSLEVKGLLRTTNIFEEPLAEGSYLHSWIFSYFPLNNFLVHLLRVVLSSTYSGISVFAELMASEIA